MPANRRSLRPVNRPGGEIYLERDSNHDLRVANPSSILKYEYTSDQAGMDNDGPVHANRGRRGYDLVLVYADLRLGIQILCKSIGQLHPDTRSTTQAAWIFVLTVHVLIGIICEVQYSTLGVG
jgi:hypothetical protein